MKHLFKKEILGFKHSTSILVGVIGINILLFLIFLATKHYPPLLVILHMLSLLSLWGLVFYGGDLGELFRAKWKEVVLISGLILIAFFVRMYRVEEITPGMYGDEITVAKYGLDLFKTPDWLPFDGSYEDYTHPTPLMYLTADSVTLFGHNKTAIRLTSIVFGALAVGAFYLFLRLFFPLAIAAAGATLMLFQYTHVILSRLAYEPIPSLFFQIVTGIFLALYVKTRKSRYLIGIALALGGGFYTYLNFRTFAVFIFLVTVFFILQSHWKKQLPYVGLFCVLLFTTTMPLISSAINDPIGFWGRVNDISIFNKGYTQSQFTNELGGNMFRTAILPFYGTTNLPPGSPPFSGDPNPDKNPSAVPMFDPITVFLAFVGFVYLFREKRTVFWVLLLLLIPPYISDIFSMEVIPEFHYYGLGHPNALRVSGFIPIILFTATAGLSWGYTKLGKNQKTAALTILSIFVLVISLWNWHWYFDQAEISPNFYVYNYQINNGKELQITDYLNKAQTNNISMTKELARDWIIPFFLTPAKQIHSFDLTSTSSAVTTINTSDITVIAVSDKSIPVLNSLVNVQSSDVFVQIVRNPVNQPVAVIFQKAGLPQSL